MATEGALLGMGNPLLDISADVPGELLEKYGVTLNNAILCEDKHKPIYDELVKDYKVQYIAGGATQNSIRVAQWMLQTPKATSFIGCIGKDEYGAQLQKSAEADGVAVHYQVDEKVETGTCAVLIKDKERSMIANLAAANCYKKEHLDTDTIKPVVENAKFVYISGFFLTVSTESIAFVGQHCCDNNKTFAMNLSAPFIPQFFKDQLLAAIPFCDYVFGNESEAEAFGKSMGYEDCSVANVALEISKIEKKNDKRPRIVVITQGSESTIVATEGKVTEYAVPALDADKIVDSNGAGDAFVGGFLAALINGKDTAESCKAGNYSASVILQVSGTELKGTPEYKF
jgi:adenosine kinase